jgi:hypothetical protein
VAGDSFGIVLRDVRITPMSVLGTRRIMETTSPETANYYLRFGWKLLNQYTVPATADTPEKVRYVMASVVGVEDTRRLITLHDTGEVNAYLELGWRLLEKYITTDENLERRQETLHFVLAWQRDEEAPVPGPATPRLLKEHITDFDASEEIPVEP